jgi:hypothetical protein
MFKALTKLLARRQPKPKIPAVYTFRDVGEARPGDFVGPSANGTYYEILVTGIHWVQFARRMANSLPGALMFCYDPRPGVINYAIAQPAREALAPIIKAAEDRRYQR